VAELSSNMVLLILIGNALGWLLHLGGPGLFALGILHSFFPIPGGMDVGIVLLSAHNQKLWWYYAGLGLAGDLTGAYLNYRVARKGGQEALEKKVPKAKSEKLSRKFEKFGGWALLVGAWVPPPMPWIPFLAAAGALQYPLRKFLSVLAFGRGIRYFAMAALGWRYGEWISSAMTSHKQEILYGLLIVGAAAGCGLLVYFSWYRARMGRGTRASGPAGAVSRERSKPPGQAPAKRKAG
jgi:membrane protein YqaA with SNARE-associated domain